VDTNGNIAEFRQHILDKLFASPVFNVRHRQAFFLLGLLSQVAVFTPVDSCSSVLVVLEKLLVLL
jgi:hypothetical protein